ncbi:MULTISPECIES: GNAT family N-acetyltransferase [Flavobacterium]|uniref:N-acetyltransferase n=2 Tax=Flavobacterium TaxID=237 RepID=A0A2N9PBP9_9FLAO|nr:MULTISPECIES: GNAT family N-acetyltransferase [Flavobacterium]QYS89113.1 GNAT family N-acetyltransferase [Flavobacterium davisii]RVU90308.1 N-acetyltransferase [Flavobacterium columnare]SPE77779.1 Putative ribosomal N-acetyltransferase YdaF [Flavobacterium columnare]
MKSFTFLPFQNLESERLILRKMTHKDVDQVFALRSNPDNMQFIPRPLLKNKEEAIELIDTINNKIELNEGINWAITEKPDDKLIGFLGYYRIQKENYRSEIGYMILPEYNGRGIATEAVQLILEYGFNQMGLHSIEAVIDPKNQASARVLEKLGFVKEGHLRENEYFEGKFWDSVIYAILKSEFNFKNIIE